MKLKLLILFILLLPSCILLKDRNKATVHTDTIVEVRYVRDTVIKHDTITYTKDNIIYKLLPKDSVSGKDIFNLDNYYVNSATISQENGNVIHIVEEKVSETLKNENISKKTKEKIKESKDNDGTKAIKLIAVLIIIVVIAVFIEKVVNMDK